MHLLPSSKLVFIGDSITDCGRRSTGEVSPWEPHFGLGDGYVSFIHAWLGADHPEAGIRVVNKGISGHTVRDLALRWEADVLAEKPTTLAVMIGINDVWRQFDSPLRPELGVGPEEYRETLSSLIAAAQSTVSAIYLATPYFIEPNRSDTMRARMDAYGAIVRQIAADSGATLVDTQAAFDRALQYAHPTSLAWDRIHPGPVGHALIARAFLQAFGCI